MPDLFESADAYDRFMGRFSILLARRFVALLHLTHGSSALDVGCGPGAVTELLVDALGPSAVSAVDPSPAFVAAARSRFPGANVSVASAESLPFSDNAFDLTVAQLVVHFMTDPVAGIREMARVTRPGGNVAASVWDFEGERGPLGVFERAAREQDPEALTESTRPGTQHGALAAIFAAAGLSGVSTGELTVSLTFATFDEWWEPFTLGVGPAGSYVASLDPARRDALREHARSLVPGLPFTIDATAWTATAVVGAA